jgi:hypothetical protein
LITGRNIINENTKTLVGNKYLLVVIDKAGNALLMNGDINIKTVNPIVLSSNEMKFDVANEKLIINEVTVDLKKISGSTNQYVEFIPQEEEETNNNNNNNTNNTNVAGGAGGTGGNAGTTTTPQKLQVPYAKRVSLRGVTSELTSLVVEYFVTDLENEYTSVFLMLSDPSGTSQKILLNKDDTQYIINGLKPSTEYTVSLNYGYYDKTTITNDYREETSDVIKLATKSMDIKLNIERLTASKIYFNLKLDSKYVLERGKVAIYINNDKYAEKDIDIISSSSTNGWSSDFDIIKGDTYTIKIIDAYYAGTKVDITTQAKIVE